MQMVSHNLSKTYLPNHIIVIVIEYIDRYIREYLFYPIDSIDYRKRCPLVQYIRATYDDEDVAVRLFDSGLYEALVSEV